MTYNADAKKLAVKVIGTVESNLNYSIINYNDPITIGIGQWFGNRAARLLNRMRNENPGAWYGVAETLNSQLVTIDENSGFWNTRYLTRAEGESLAGVLTRNQELQNTQLSTDLDAYVDVFISYNFDPQAHTDTLIYFMSMHHQGPLYALEIILTLDTECTLEEMHQACLTHVSESAGVVVLGKYGSRYNTTYDLIKAADFSGVDPTPPDPPDPLEPVNGTTKFIEQRGDVLYVTFKDGEKLACYPNGTGFWFPRKGILETPPPDPEQPPPPPETGDWFHPLPGATITSPFGPRGFDGFHWGVDLSTTTAPSGGDIIAVCDMVVTVAYNAGTGGNVTAGGYVKGHTLDGSLTWSYNHMAPGTVIPNAGDTITAGTKIGVEGQTGNVTGTHLHLEVYEGNYPDPWVGFPKNPIDPLPILRAHGVNI